MGGRQRKTRQVGGQASQSGGRATLLLSYLPPPWLFGQDMDNFSCDLSNCKPPDHGNTRQNLSIAAAILL